MRLSDYVIKFLKDNYNVDTVFTVSGGGCIFLVDSLTNVEGVSYMATHHEQAAAIAAEGYARLGNRLGVCLVTSGPGGTNALTGTLCNFLDSIPVLYISGQVNREMTTNYTNLPLRQLGDQEFNIVKVVEPLTKYAYQVNDASEIKYHLEKACKLAVSGRPGPVWLDIPLNVQSATINPDELLGFTEELSTPSATEDEIDSIIQKWNSAKRPLIIVGNGIRLSGGVDLMRTLCERTNVPVISAVNGNDIITSDYRYYYGRFGTHAQICANTLLNECDFLLTIGSRLYVRQTGYNFTGFAKNAYKVYVDIDENELSKPTLYPDMKVVSDASQFITKLLQRTLPVTNTDWLDKCDNINTAPKVLDRHRNKTDYVSHYHFVEKLEKHIPHDYHIVTSDGSANVVTMQVLNLKGNQRLVTNTGSAPMGYGLPAALGAAVHHKIVCIEGDGSLHLNIHELQTVVHYNLPIKIILLNNDGYLSIKISQKTFFGGKLVASDTTSGVSFPNFEKLTSAYNLPYFKVKTHEDIDTVLSSFFNEDGPAICEVFTDPDEFHEPKVVASLDENGKFIPGMLENIKWVL
jgi:acetolactate synthase-1/2/3 large subunit